MKKRIRRCDPQRRSYWEEVVRRWEQGGQSVREFCRAEGLREPAFYFWRRKLGRSRPASDTADELSVRAPAAVSALRPRKAASPPRPGKASFLPVRVVEDREAASHAVEIVLAGGRTVRVRSGFDRQTLADVLALLEVRPC